jgi:hypothetical protein
MVKHFGSGESRVEMQMEGSESENESENGYLATWLPGTVLL